MNENKLDDRIDYLVYLLVLSERENYIALAKNSIFPSQVFWWLLQCSGVKDLKYEQTCCDALLSTS